MRKQGADETKKPADRSAGLLKGNLNSVLVAAGVPPSVIVATLTVRIVSITVSIGGLAIRLGVPHAETLAVINAAKSKSFTAKWIESAPTIGVFSPLDQPVTETTAFFKSFPRIVLTIVAVTVAPSPVLGESVRAFGGASGD